MKAAPAPALWHIDRPGYRPVGQAFALHGWVAVDRPLDALEPLAGRFLSFAWVDRPDLVPPPGGRAWARGFEATAEAAVLADELLVCRARGPGGTHELHWRFREAVEPARKRRKLVAIQALLADGARPRATRDFLNFLPSDAPMAEPALTSGFYYPEAVDALVARHADGWILDCGAGHRPVYHDNVVNLEIAPYPSTDVLADAERLPFRDACFDAVVTLAVLEHVRRPWQVARELVRVLKPGGTLVADVPLLQPVHAYPHHFFNMTSEGLQSLFADACDIVAADVPHYGRPVYTLAWFLQRYAAGLPEEVRGRFLELRVADLVAPAERQAAADYVAALPKAFEFELASVTSIVACKR